VQKTPKIILRAESADAVLSHSPAEQAGDLAATEFDPFDQAYDHPHIRQHRRSFHLRIRHDHLLGAFDRRRLLPIGGLCRRGRRRLATLPAGIETFLSPFSLRRLIVRGTPLAGGLSAMMLPAAERTTQVPSASIAGMSQKANPAASAVHAAPLQLGMGLQDHVQRGMILPDERFDAIVLMPIRATREKPRDGYGKKAKFSVILSIVLVTPSSYLFDAIASRGRARFFLRNERKSSSTASTINPLRMVPPGQLPCRFGADILRVKS
jgi:hypothetical protein